MYFPHLHIPIAGLTSGRQSQIDTNSHYYYKFPASSQTMGGITSSGGLSGGGGGAESDNDSLYTKPEERAAIVRPQRPQPLQQPLKLSILKPTAAAASAAKGALLSKFLPPWANRASHLSSASWVCCEGTNFVQRKYKFSVSLFC